MSDDSAPSAEHLIELADHTAARGLPVTFGADRWQIISAHCAEMIAIIAGLNAELEHTRSTIAWNRDAHQRTEHGLRLELGQAQRKIYELTHGIEEQAS